MKFRAIIFGFIFAVFATSFHGCFRADGEKQKNKAYNAVLSGTLLANLLYDPNITNWNLTNLWTRCSFAYLFFLRGVIFNIAAVLNLREEYSLNTKKYFFNRQILEGGTESTKKNASAPFVPP